MGVTNYLLSRMILQVVVSSRRCKLWKSRLGAGFKDFSKISPAKFGEMIQFWRLHIFQMGWNSKPPTRRCCLKQIVEATPQNILVSRAHRICATGILAWNITQMLVNISYLDPIRSTTGHLLKWIIVFKGKLGVPQTVYPWYLLCSLGILGDYNP